MFSSRRPRPALQAPETPEERARLLKRKAIDLLSRRDHSVAELKKKLARYAESEDELDRLSQQLKQLGYLSEERFAAGLARRSWERFGSLKVAEDFKQHQLPFALAQPELSVLQESELPRCCLVWRKRFSALPEDLKERARQTRFLQARGFSLNIISRVLKSSLTEINAQAELAQEQRPR